MSRFRIFLSVAAMAFVATLLLAGWLGYSESGARWLFEKETDWGGVQIRVKSVSGQLAKRLDLQGVSIDLGEIQLTIDSAELDWSPWSLLRRELQVERLVVTGMDIVDLLPATHMSTTAGPSDVGSFVPAEAWPLPAWLSGRIGLLQLHDFNYRDAEGPVVIAELIEARLGLKDHLLVAETLNYISPYVHLEGSARWNLQTMDLDYQAGVSLPPELVDAESLAVAALPVAIPGHLQVQGDWTAYRGTLALGDTEVALTAAVQGTLDGVWFNNLQGNWLQGRLRDGRLDLDWSGDFRMDWQARAEGLNPEATVLGHPGRLSFLTSGYLAVPAVGPVVIDGDLTDLQGQIDGRPLSGHGRARWAGEELVFEQVLLESEGLHLAAGGVLTERLDLDLQIADLGHWLAGAAGRLATRGWLAWDGESLSGDLAGRCEQLQWQAWELGRVEFSASYSDSETPAKLSVQAQGFQFEELRFSGVQLEAAGLLEQHHITLATQSEYGHLQLQASGGWNGEAWVGELQQLSTRLLEGSELVLQAPAGMRWSSERWALSPLLLTDAEGETLRLGGHYQSLDRHGDISAFWTSFHLQRFGSFFPELTLAGRSSGELSLSLTEGIPEQLVAKIEAEGSFKHSAWGEALDKVHLDLDWTDRQLTLSLAASGGVDTRLELDGEAQQPVGYAVPEQGYFQFRVNNVRLIGLRPWLPPELELDGQASLQGEGNWLGGGRFSLNAHALSQGGHVLWHEARGLFQANLEQVDLGLRWQAEQLEVKAELALGEQGELHAEVSLPLEARWPLHFDQVAPLSGLLRGHLVETGLLAAVLPIPVEEVKGQLQIDARLAGRWQQPELSGELQLQDAGGYFPQLGIGLKPLELKLLFQGNRVQIEQLRLVSAGSEILGTGEIQWGQGRIESYRLHLVGKDFQTVDLPELRLLLSPDLQLEGDLHGLRARGKIEIPQMLLRGTQAAGDIRTSPDVIVIQQQTEAEQIEVFKSDVDVKVVLGDQVKLSAVGLNARMTGTAQVKLDELGSLRANGMIRVAEGDYAAYGTKLKITQGVIRYQNAPVDDPDLNLLALRDIGRVKAGVQITGTARRPEVTLYSKPAMPEKDILFTILTGRPATEGSEDKSALMIGGRALLAPGESVLEAVGLTDVDFGGLFAGDGGLRLRRRLNDNWEVESVLGTNSGVDLFYVIEFD
jgi:translocation and assembly module TamB